MAPHPILIEPGSAVPDAALKAELRAAALAARDALDPDARRAASAAIADALVALPELAGAGIVGAYWPIRSEVDPRQAVEAMRARGQRMALPQVTTDGLVFREWRRGDALIAGRFGLSEPHPSLQAVDPDALIVPLAAFDRAGQRIGYGAGHFDAAIARLSTARALMTVGVGFATQEIDRVPAEPHDRPLRMIVTETGVVRVGGAA